MVEVVLVTGVVAIDSQGEEVAGVVGSQIEEVALVDLMVATNGEIFQFAPRSPWTQALQSLKAEEFSDNEENLKTRLACRGNLQSILARYRFFLQVYNLRLDKFLYAMFISFSGNFCCVPHV